MAWLSEIRAGFQSVGLVVAALALVSLVEAVLPRRRRGPLRHAHFGPNLALGACTLALNAAGGAAIVLLLAREAERGVGLLRAFELGGFAELAVALLVLDFSLYVAHFSMHRIPLFWRFHSVHHADRIVDATTTFRQHPGEAVIRFAFTLATAGLLGTGPASYAIYRVAVAMSGLLEHADIRIPRSLDRKLALVTTWPGFHKLHHSRDRRSTDSNYGNLVSWWDRLFGTLSPCSLGESVDYGLDGLDDARTQSISGSLWLPFRRALPAERTLREMPGAGSGPIPDGRTEACLRTRPS